MKPVFAIVGRPNVGKSTLFNRLTRSRDALVADSPGLTRDRKYGTGSFGDHRFVVIDTGGIGEGLEGVDEVVKEQASLALAEANVVLFLVDSSDGLTAADEQIAQQLRELNKPVHLVVNKIDGQDADAAAAEFYALGIDSVLKVAASQGRGLKHLLTRVLATFPPSEAEQVEDHGIKVAVLGRPNVGKSTLVNRMLGEDRVVVFDQSGTTRDSISIPYEREGQAYTLIDTAGVRRRGKVYETVEKFSVVKALQAIEEAHVVLLVVDGTEGITEQDMNLLGHAMEAGRAIVLVVNKWDGLPADHREQVKEELDRRLHFAPWLRRHTISALHGTGVGDLYGFIQTAYESAFLKLNTAQMTRLLEEIVAQRSVPMIGRSRLKLRYAHLGGSNPPRIIIHGNHEKGIPDDYRRYLENKFRQILKMEGTPVKVEFKTGKNPYEGRKNVLTDRQRRRRKRLIKKSKR